MITTCASCGADADSNPCVACLLSAPSQDTAKKVEDLELVFDLNGTDYAADQLREPNGEDIGLKGVAVGNGKAVAFLYSAEHVELVKSRLTALGLKFLKRTTGALGEQIGEAFQSRGS